MRVKKLSYFLICCIFTVTILTGCGGRTETPKTNVPQVQVPSPSPVGTWTKVSEYSGQGNKVTETFMISSKKTKVKWEITGDSNVRVIIIPKVNPSEPQGMMDNITGLSEAFFNLKPDTYYLDIKAPSETKWSFIIEEQVNK